MSDQLFDRRKPGFYIIDNEIADIYGEYIGAYGVAVYNYLVKCANCRGENSFPAYETIAKKLDISRTKAITTVNELMDVGLISIVKRFVGGRQISNVYEIIDVKSMDHALIKALISKRDAERQSKKADSTPRVPSTNDADSTPRVPSDSTPRVPSMAVDSTPRVPKEEEYKTQYEEEGGDHTIQDHPGASEAETPPPTAALPEKPATTPNPGKPEEPKPIRGGATQPVQPVKNLGHLPINGYNHRQAGNGGFEGLMQAARDNANGSGYKSTEKDPADIYSAGMKALGVDPAEFTAMVNALLDATGKRAVVDMFSDEQETKLLNDHKSLLLSVAKVWQSFRCAADVKAVATDFFVKNKNFAANGVIHLSQFKAHAAILASKPKPTPTPTTAPDFRGCTIVDVPTPAPTAEQVADAELERDHQRLQHQLNVGPILYSQNKAKQEELLNNWRNWNANHPTKPVTFPAEWKHLAA